MRFYRNNSVCKERQISIFLRFKIRSLFYLEWGWLCFGRPFLTFTRSMGSGKGSFWLFFSSQTRFIPSICSNFFIWFCCPCTSLLLPRSTHCCCLTSYLSSRDQNNLQRDKPQDAFLCMLLEIGNLLHYRNYKFTIGCV